MDTKKTVLLIVLLCVTAAALVALLVLRGGLGQPDMPELTRTEDGTIILTPEPAAAATVPPAKTADTQHVTAASRWKSSDVPVQIVPADAAYFADAAFVGNETVAALKLYDYDGLLTEAAFYEVETITDTDYVNQIKEDGGYGKIYIGLGGHELAYKADVVRDSLRSAIGSLQAEYPECLIYLMSVSPVSQYRTSVSKAIRMDRIEEYNEMLTELAEEMGVWYLDITSGLVDEEGYLPSEVTEDGLNFTPGHYAAWYEVLAARYIGDTE